MFILRCIVNVICAVVVYLYLCVSDVLFFFLFVFFYCCFFFFFQAEDGIRDLVRSRGLGDVYKRQILITLYPFLSNDIVAEYFYTCRHPQETASPSQ